MTDDNEIMYIKHNKNRGEILHCNYRNMDEGYFYTMLWNDRHMLIKKQGDELIFYNIDKSEI